MPLLLHWDDGNASRRTEWCKSLGREMMNRCLEEVGGAPVDVQDMHSIGGGEVMAGTDGQR